MPTTRAFAAIFISVLLFGAVRIAAAGGWIEDRDGKTIIHVVVCPEVFPNPAFTDPANRAHLASAREFLKQWPKFFAERYREKYKAHPEIYGHHNWDNVEYSLDPFSSIFVEGVETDLLAIAGDMAPDIVYVNFRKSDNYIRERFLYPLDKPEDGYLAGLTKEEVDARIVPKLWPVVDRKGPDGEKHVWALPYGGGLGKVLLFRKDLFDSKNIPHPTANWTWEEMLDAAKKLTDAKRGTYGFAFSPGIHESWYWVTFLWSAGGEAMEYDEATDKWRCAFDSWEAAKALDFYITINAEKWYDADGQIHRGYSDRDPSEGGTKWERGEIAMNFGYVSGTLLSQISPEVTGMVPVPFGPPDASGKRMRGAELNSTMMGLFSQIKHPAVRDAAWEFMRWVETPESMAIKTRVMVEGGLGRFLNPKQLRAYGYPEIERLSPPGWAENFQMAINSGKPEPYGRNSNIAYNMMTFPIVEAMEMSLHDQLPEDPKERLGVMHDLLVKATARANEEMIGTITPKQQLQRRIAAVVVLAAIVVGFAFVFRKIFNTFAGPTNAAGVKQAKWAFRRYAWAYLLLVPALLTIFVWQYFPLFRGSTMAFQDYRLIGKSVWVGVDNFGDVIADSDWWNSVWNSIRYSLYVIGLTFLPPILLAILLQEIPKGKLLMRTIYYLPAVITGLVTVLLWKQFYDPSVNGVLNAIVMNVPAGAFVLVGVALLVLAIMFARRMFYHEMNFAGVVSIVVGVLLLVAFSWAASGVLIQPNESFGHTVAQFFPRLFEKTVEPYRWREDRNVAMLSCVIPMVWAGCGPGCLIYLAALKGIPDDYFEAADIDGATFIDKIILVVFPILKPLIIINFVGAFIGAWYGAAGNVLAMTGGGGDTKVADLNLWYKAFTFLKFGPATAMAWMLGFMLIGFTVYQLQILSRVEFKAAAATDKT